jgi:hypothetical protein
VGVVHTGHSNAFSERSGFLVQVFAGKLVCLDSSRAAPQTKSELSNSRGIFTYVTHRLHYSQARRITFPASTERPGECFRRTTARAASPGSCGGPGNEARSCTDLPYRSKRGQSAGHRHRYPGR